MKLNRSVQGIRVVVLGELVEVVHRLALLRHCHISHHYLILDRTMGLAGRGRFEREAQGGERGHRDSTRDVWYRNRIRERRGEKAFNGHSEH